MNRNGTKSDPVGVGVLFWEHCSASKALSDLMLPISGSYTERAWEYAVCFLSMGYMWVEHMQQSKNKYLNCWNLERGRSGNKFLSIWCFFSFWVSKLSLCACIMKETRCEENWGEQIRGELSTTSQLFASWFHTAAPAHWYQHSTA